MGSRGSSTQGSRERASTLRTFLCVVMSQPARTGSAATAPRNCLQCRPRNRAKVGGCSKYMLWMVL